VRTYESEGAGGEEPGAGGSVGRTYESEGAGAGNGRRPVVVRTYELELADGDLLVRATESVDRKSGVSLATARGVVGGGRGVGGPDGFAVLEELADLLGGALGLSDFLCEGFSGAFVSCSVSPARRGFSRLRD